MVFCKDVGRWQAHLNSWQDTAVRMEIRTLYSTFAFTAVLALPDYLVLQEYQASSCKKSFLESPASALNTSTFAGLFLSWDICSEVGCCLLMCGRHLIRTSNVPSPVVTLVLQSYTKRLLRKLCDTSLESAFTKTRVALARVSPI